MMDVSLTECELDQGPAPIRALRSLRPQQADRVAQAVMAWPGAWSVERHDDYDGYLSMLVSAVSPVPRTFLVAGVADSIELLELRQESLFSLGRFDTVDGMVGRLAVAAAAPCGSATWDCRGAV